MIMLLVSISMKLLYILNDYVAVLLGETALHKAARKSHFASYNLLVIEGKANEECINFAHETPAEVLKDDIRY